MQELDASEEPLLDSDGPPTSTPKKFLQLAAEILHMILYPLRWAWGSGVVCIIVSEGLHSWLGVLTKELAKIQVPLMQTLLIRGIVGAILSWAAARYGGSKTGFGPQKLWGLLLASCTSGSIALLTVWFAFKLIPVGDATAIANLAPIFTVLFAWVIRWESLNWIICTGAVLCSCGAVLIAKPPFLFGGQSEWDEKRCIGVICAFLHAISAAVAYMFAGRIGERIQTATLLLWLSLSGILSTSIPLFASFPVPPVWHLTTRQVMMILQFVSLGLCAYVALIRGFQLCNAAQGTALKTVGVAFSYPLGYFVLHEELNRFIFVGAPLIGIGVWVLAVGKACRENRKVVQEAKVFAES